MKKKDLEDKNSGVNDRAPAETVEQLELDLVTSTETALEQEEDSRQEEIKFVDEIRETLQGVLSENTLRAYLADSRNFMGWCRESGHHAIPAEVATLVTYVEWMGTQYKAATIRRRLDSLRSVFYYLKLTNATKDPDVQRALKRCFRKIGRHQNQAIPLTKKYLIPMLKVCGNDIRGLRNRVLLQLGYESLRRRSEFCNLCFEDIDFYPNGVPYILLRFSKTDQFGNGRSIPISQELYELIKRWRRKIGAEDGFILRSVRRGGRVEESLNPESVNIILREIQMRTF